MQTADDSVKIHYACYQLRCNKILINQERFNNQNIGKGNKLYARAKRCRYYNESFMKNVSKTYFIRKHVVIRLMEKKERVYYFLTFLQLTIMVCPYQIQYKKRKENTKETF